jgi:hypothetical protein
MHCFLFVFIYYYFYLCLFGCKILPVSFCTLPVFVIFLVILETPPCLLLLAVILRLLDVPRLLTVCRKPSISCWTLIASVKQIGRLPLTILNQLMYVSSRFRFFAPVFLYFLPAILFFLCLFRILFLCICTVFVFLSLC